MNKKRKDLRNKAKLEFIANNVNSVTGSSFHLNFYDKDLDRDVQILIELGGCQENSILENYVINNKLIEKIDVKNLDFVILLHSHADHSILVPALATKNFNGKIITTKENKAILPAMWADACYINMQEVEWLKKNKKNKDRTYKPYYKMSDIDIIKDHITDIPVNQIINLTPNIQINFIPNKHILGSVSCEIMMKDTNSRVHKFFYSSDLGNVNNNYFVSDTQKPPKSCMVSCYESTYGLRSKDLNYKKMRKQELELLEKTLEQTLLNGGNCLIPCFSLQRTPTILKYLKEIMDKNDKICHIPVIVDGKLTNELLDIYEKICEGQDKSDIDEILNWDNVTRIRSYKETIKFTDDKEPKIILASSGMMQAGHVLEWAKQIVPRKKDCIIFCGYSVEGSLADKIKQQEQKTIKIDKSIVLMNCQIITLNSFSSHIMRQDLINYITQTNTSDYICLVHGSEDAKMELCEDICKRLEDECVSTKVVVPKKNQIIYF